MSVCFSCFGKGYFPEEGGAECPYCNGTGFISDDDEEDEEFVIIYEGGEDE